MVALLKTQGIGKNRLGFWLEVLILMLQVAASVFGLAGCLLGEPPGSAASWLAMALALLAVGTRGLAVVRSRPASPHVAVGLILLAGLSYQLTHDGMIPLVAAITAIGVMATDYAWNRFGGRQSRPA